MTIAEMKHHFTHRELGIQGAVGEYAILVPLAQWEGKLCLLFETRAETLVGHQPGEVCFPGGRRERGERPVETALRETWEEIGIPPEEIEILAPLDVIQDISDRVVYPFLGTISPQGVDRLAASAAEVKNVFFVPLDYLMHYPEEVYRYTVSAQVDDQFPYERMGFPKNYPWRTGFMDVPIYEYEGHFIWGMTARTVRWLLRGSCGRWKGKGEPWSRWNFWAGTGLPNRTPVLSWAGTAWLLARFCTLRPRWSVCDLGCGVGSLLLLLSQREEALDRVGVELDPVAAGLARRNLSDNGLEGQVLTGDLRDRALLKGDRFQLVIANPPYFRAGSGKSGGQARMDDTCPVDDLCRAAGRLAKTGGRFALVYRPERLAELFAALRGARLEPKRLQLLSYGPSSPPYAVLVEAVKEGGPGLEILPVHYQTESAH